MDEHILSFTGANAGAHAVVSIGVPLILVAVVFYLCKHRKHKPITALLGFVIGSLLGTTVLGVAITSAAVAIVQGIVNAATNILQ